MSTNTLICPHCQKEFIPQVKIYDDGYLYADPNGFVVRVQGKRIKLTATEHRLLACLLANADRVVTHRQLLLSLWGFEYQNDVDFVRIYVCSLRAKIESDPANPRYIITESGLGYYFNKEAKNAYYIQM